MYVNLQNTKYIYKFQNCNVQIFHFLIDKKEMWSKIETIFLKQNKPFPYLGHVQLEYFFKEYFFLDLVKQNYCHIKKPVCWLILKEVSEILIMNDQWGRTRHGILWLWLLICSQKKFLPNHDSFFIGQVGMYWRQNNSFVCLLHH